VTSTVVEMAKYLVRRPLAALPLLRAGWRLRRRGWWRHAPFVPVAPGAYWLFRVVTATGDGKVLPRADEMVRAARWATRQRVER
jgi:hypothetical protein